MNPLFFWGVIAPLAVVWVLWVYALYCVFRAIYAREGSPESRVNLVVLCLLAYITAGLFSLRVWEKFNGGLTPDRVGPIMSLGPTLNGRNR